MAMTMMGDDKVVVLDPNHPAMNDNYNSHAIPCPCQDARSGLVGYAMLSSLYKNFHDYHAPFAMDMPTYYPTESYAPLTTTIAPTYTPTVTGSSLPPTEGPTTEVPTYPPITYRPTEFPTSSIREPKVPMRLPAPTIELFIAGLTDPNADDDVDDDGVNGTGTGGEEGGSTTPHPPTTTSMGPTR